MQPESKLDKKIQDYCEKNNIWVMKVWGNGMQRSGIPDLIMCVDGAFVALETKIGYNKASKLQEYEIKKINESGGYASTCYSMDEFLKTVDYIKKYKRI